MQIRPNHTFRPAAWAVLCALHVILAASFLGDRSPGTAAAVTGFPLDDAWIHLVYGRELAHHGRLFYNTGELEAGFTSPVWILCTGFAELLGMVSGVSSVATVKTLGVLSAACASLLVFELNLTLTGNAVISLVLAGIAAGTPLVAFSQLSGMEVGLASAWLLAAILMLERRSYSSAGIYCGLAYLTRPECVVLAPLLLLGVTIAERRSAHGTRALGSAVAKVLLPLLMAAGTWALYCLAVNGHPLPNTFYVKYQQADLAVGLVQVVREIVLDLPLAFGSIGCLVYLVGAVELARTGRAAGLAVLGLPWLFLVAVAASRPMPQGCGLYFYWWRYVLSALPALYVPAAAGAGLLWRMGGGDSPWTLRTSGGVRKALCALCLLLLLLVPLSRYPWQLGFRRQLFSWNCQNINEVQVALGHWVNTTVPPDEAVFVNDSGAIRYFGNRRTIDLLGLNNHDLAFRKTRLEHLRWDVAEMTKAMSELRATHLVVFPSWFPRLVASPDFPARFVAVASFASGNYTASPAQQESMVAYRRLP